MVEMKAVWKAEVLAEQWVVRLADDFVEQMVAMMVAMKADTLVVCLER